MNKYIKISTAIALSMSILTACSKDEQDIFDEKTYNGCFAAFTTPSGALSRGDNSVSYTMNMNYTTGMARIDISGLDLPDGTSYPTLRIVNIPFKINKQGWLELTAPLTKATVPGTSTSLTITQLSAGIFDYYDNAEKQYDGFYASFSIDDKYSVLSAPRTQYLFGNSTSASASTYYQTIATNYILYFDAETAKVDIMMQNTSFITQMPAMDIMLEKIPFTISGTTASFKADNIVPKIGNTPYPGYEITDLDGYLNFSSKLWMEFNCHPEKMPMDFHCTADCPYTD